MIQKSKNSHSKSSKLWLNEHFNDFYVKLAREKGYRARSAFKLIEINNNEKLISPGMSIVDLGSSPGSWSQVVSKILNGTGKIIALDIIPMEYIVGVDFIEGDFSDKNILLKLQNMLGNNKIDLVISDIAPNKSGNSIIDQGKNFYLADLCLDFVINNLKQGGSFLVKVFQGYGYNEFLIKMKKYFEKVIVKKPKASRDRSNELYLLGKNFN